MRRSATASLRRFLPSEGGVPSHDTLDDATGGRDMELPGSCFDDCMETLRDGQPDIIAVDGETSHRGHGEAGKRGPLHFVSAWVICRRLELGREATTAKSSDITAPSVLLERPEFFVAVVTAAAMARLERLAHLAWGRGGTLDVRRRTGRDAGPGSPRPRGRARPGPACR